MSCVATTAQRDDVRLLRRTLSRRDFFAGDETPNTLLPVQHHLSVLVAQHTQRHWVLASGRLRREGDAWHHRAARVFRLHVADRRKHTSHVRVRASHW